MKNKRVTNPRIQTELNTLQYVRAMVDRISRRELPIGSVTNPGWTEFEMGKDHGYETIIANLDIRIDTLKEEETNWKKGANSSQDQSPAYP